MQSKAQAGNNAIAAMWISKSLFAELYMLVFLVYADVLIVLSLILQVYGGTP